MELFFNHSLIFLEEAFISDSFSRRNGFLQNLDPRAKLVSILALIFATSLIGDLRLLIFVYMLTLLFSYLSKIDVLFFIKRVWLFIPIFAGIIAIPMIFNIFFPGDPLISLVYLGPGAHLGPFSLPDSIYITRQGDQYRCDIYHACSNMCIYRSLALPHHTPADPL